jgi:hypothetical protein
MEGRRCSRGLLRPSQRLPWKATPGKARWVRAVCTNPGCLWKGLRDDFFDFMTGQNPPKSQVLPEVPQRASLRQQNQGANAT